MPKGYAIENITKKCLNIYTRTYELTHTYRLKQYKVKLCSLHKITLAGVKKDII